MNLEDLKKPFPTEDLEWRVQKSGIGNNSKKPYALVVCYITSRAVQDRLDEVCTPENWKNQFAPAPNGGVICGISIRIKDEWITKWDGADNTHIEATKGGLSDAMKRAAVHWGIGRYLYKLDKMWAQFDKDGKYKDKIEGEYCSWNPPPLPSWAMADMKDVIRKIESEGAGNEVTEKDNEKLPF